MNTMVFGFIKAVNFSSIFNYLSVSEQGLGLIEFVN